MSGSQLGEAQLRECQRHAFTGSCKAALSDLIYCTPQEKPPEEPPEEGQESTPSRHDSEEEKTLTDTLQGPGNVVGKYAGHGGGELVENVAEEGIADAVDSVGVS